MSEEVKFNRGNDRISQLAQRPDIAAEVAQVRADMAEADRSYAGSQPSPPGFPSPEDPEN